MDDKGLEDLLTKVDDHDRGNKNHKRVSILIILIIFFLVLLGLFQFIFDIKDFKYRAVTEIFNSTKKTLSLQSVRKDSVLLLVKNSEGKSEIRIFDNLNNNIQDLSSGVANVEVANLSNDGNTIAYLKEENGKLFLVIQKWRNQKAHKKLILAISDAVKSIKDLNSPEEIKACSWSTIEWSSNDSNILFYLCYQSSSILATVEVKKDLVVKLHSETKAKIIDPRTGKWLSEKIIIFTTDGRDKYSLNKIDIGKTKNGLKTLYSLERKK